MRYQVKFLIAKAAFVAIVAIILAVSTTANANTFPPAPTKNFFADADGDTLTTGLDVIQMNNYILSRPNTWDTVQPSAPAQAWNTCDWNSDRVLTGLDVIPANNYVLSKPVITGDTPWVLENNLALGGIDTAGSYTPGSPVAFSVNLYSTDPITGPSGRAGFSVVATINLGLPPAVVPPSM